MAHFLDIYFNVIRSAVSVERLNIAHFQDDIEDEMSQEAKLQYEK